MSQRVRAPGHLTHCISALIFSEVFAAAPTPLLYLLCPIWLVHFCLFVIHVIGDNPLWHM